MSGAAVSGAAVSGAVRVERHDGVVVATLDRPAKRNAIDQATIDDLHALCASLEAEPATLILTGAGGVFAGGADIAQLRERRAPDAHRAINAGAFIRVARLPMPVIAAIDGFALGGGAELAYAADIRIGTEAVRIGNPEPGLGIIAAAGASWRLAEIVGDGLASDMLLTGRILSGTEALAAGLITALHEPNELLPAALAIAERIRGLSPAAVMATKRAMRAPRAAHPEVDCDEQAVLFDSDDKHERMTAFLERKARR